MIERFEAGKWYRWTGPRQRQASWCSNGAMDFILDGAPHQCSASGADPRSAAFHDSPYPFAQWSWNSGFEWFEECAAPVECEIDGWRYLGPWDTREAASWVGKLVRYGDTPGAVYGERMRVLERIVPHENGPYCLNGTTWNFIGVPVGVVRMTREEVASRLGIPAERLQIVDEGGEA